MTPSEAVPDLELTSWGWDDRWAELARSAHQSLQPGRVTTQEKSRWAVQTADGPVPALILPTQMGETRPAVGDWVLVRQTGLQDPWVIERVLPRKSGFYRRAAGSTETEQVVAANIDKVWIVHGFDTQINERRLERYLSVSWESGAQPEIILTKVDVASDPEEAEAIATRIAFGVPVRSVSALSGAGVPALHASLLPGETVALLGPSGVGKSSLINRLAGSALFETAPVRERDSKGRHTTTRRQLVQIGGGALLLDTPGMRELQVWELDEGLDLAFPEIERLARHCRFRDCTHVAEPRCAVIAAANSGDLDPRRLQSYHKLRAEAAHQHRKADPLAQKAALAEWKSVMKSMKHHPKYRDRR